MDEPRVLTWYVQSVLHCVGLFFNQVIPHFLMGSSGVTGERAQRKQGRERRGSRGGSAEEASAVVRGKRAAPRDPAHPASSLRVVPVRAQERIGLAEQA